MSEMPTVLQATVGSSPPVFPAGVSWKAGHFEMEDTWAHNGMKGLVLSRYMNTWMLEEVEYVLISMLMIEICRSTNMFMKKGPPSSIKMTLGMLVKC